MNPNSRECQMDRIGYLLARWLDWTG